MNDRGTIYQSYGVRLSRNACGTDPDPLPSAMSSISIQAFPLGYNRQGGACQADNLDVQHAPAIPLCGSAVSLGDTLPGGWYCSTAGCR